MPDVQKLIERLDDPETSADAVDDTIKFLRSLSTVPLATLESDQGGWWGIIDLGEPPAFTTVMSSQRSDIEAAVNAVNARLAPQPTEDEREWLVKSLRSSRGGYDHREPAPIDYEIADMIFARLRHSEPSGERVEYSPWKPKTRCNARGAGTKLCQLPPNHDSDHLHVYNGRPGAAIQRWPRRLEGEADGE